MFHSPAKVKPLRPLFPPLSSSAQIQIPKASQRSACYRVFVLFSIILSLVIPFSSKGLKPLPPSLRYSLGFSFPNDSGFKILALLNLLFVEFSLPAVISCYPIFQQSQLYNFFPYFHLAYHIFNHQKTRIASFILADIIFFFLFKFTSLVIPFSSEVKSSCSFPAASV